jgi:uncharacterized membrane protein YdjX (TVP38/TMEM64 family)
MDTSADPPSRRSFPWGKLIALLLLAILSLVAFVFFRDDLSLAKLAHHEARLREFYERHWLATYALVFVLYVALNGISLPGAGTALTLFFGWFFGFWRAVILVSFGSTAGATVAFLLSRYLLRELVANRFPERLRLVQDAFARDGVWYLLTLRLLPVVPYFLINILMGLTTIRARTFWWASQVGMFPATCLYTYAASTVPSLEQLAATGVRGVLTPQLFVALTLLGLFPLVVRRLLARGREDASG